MPVSIFAIPQVVNLVVPETSGAGPRIRMNYPVNRTDFRLIRGALNHIEFFLRDIDRQPYPITAPDVPVLAISDLRDRDRLLLEVEMTETDPARSLWRATLRPEDIQRWQEGMLRYVVYLRQGSDRVMLWTDRDYSPYGMLRLSEPPIPDPAPSLDLDPASFILRDGWAYSSIIAAPPERLRDAAQTVSFDLDAFAGDLRIEGTLEAQPSQNDADWFQIAIRNMPISEPHTGTVAITFAQPVVAIRLGVRRLLGSVTAISYRN